MQTICEIANINNRGYAKIILENANEGTYIFICQGTHNKTPDFDYLQEDLKDAKRMCLQEFGVPLDNWMKDPEIRCLMSEDIS